MCKARGTERRGRIPSLETPLEEGGPKGVAVHVGVIQKEAGVGNLPSEEAAEKSTGDASRRGQSHPDDTGRGRKPVSNRVNVEVRRQAAGRATPDNDISGCSNTGSSDEVGDESVADKATFVVNLGTLHGGAGMPRRCRRMPRRYNKHTLTLTMVRVSFFPVIDPPSQ